MLLTKKERFGESIAILRRALALGAPEKELLGPLGRAFLKRDKLIPALAILEHAKANGIEHPEIDADLNQLKEKLKEAKIDWTVPMVFDPVEPVSE